MQKVFQIVLCILFLLELAQSRPQDVLHEIGTDRYQAFLQSKESKYMVLMFKGPHCTSCNWLIYETVLISYYYDSVPEIEVGYTLTANSTELAELCDVDVDSAIPEYRLISKKDKQCYSRMSKDSFEQWIRSYTGHSFQPSYVDELTDANYHDYINSALQQEKNVFVLFYTPWSNECQDITINYERIGKLFHQESHLLMTKIDCQDQPDRCLEYNITEFPSYRYYSYLSSNDNQFMYKTQFGYGILKFLNEQMNTYYTMDGGKNEDYGRVPLLDQYIRDYFNGNEQQQKEIRKLILKERTRFANTKIYFKYLKMYEKQESLESLAKELSTQLKTISVSDAKYDSLQAKFNILSQFLPLPTTGVISVSPVMLERYKTINKPLLLLFSTEWCLKCVDVKEMMKELASQHYKDVVYLQMDGDKHSDYIDLNHIDGYPRFHWYDNRQQKYLLFFLKHGFFLHSWNVHSLLPMLKERWTASNNISILILTVFSAPQVMKNRFQSIHSNHEPRIISHRSIA